MDYGVVAEGTFALSCRYPLAGQGPGVVRQRIMTSRPSNRNNQRVFRPFVQIPRPQAGTRGSGRRTVSSNTVVWQGIFYVRAAPFCSLRQPLPVEHVLLRYRAENAEFRPGKL
jgi:hypothetical protein